MPRVFKITGRKKPGPSGRLSPPAKRVYTSVEDFVKYCLGDRIPITGKINEFVWEGTYTRYSRIYDEVKIYEKINDKRVELVQEKIVLEIELGNALDF